MTEENRIRESMSSLAGGVTQARLDKLRLVHAHLTKAERKILRIVQVPDEFTGARYGKAKARRGKCRKIGSGGRNAKKGKSYQIWLDWS